MTKITESTKNRQPPSKNSDAKVTIKEIAQNEETAKTVKDTIHKIIGKGSSGSSSGSKSTVEIETSTSGSSSKASVSGSNNSRNTNSKTKVITETEKVQHPPEISVSTSSDGNSKTTTIVKKITTVTTEQKSVVQDKSSPCYNQPDGTFLLDPENVAGYLSCTKGKAFNMVCPEGLRWNVHGNRCDNTWAIQIITSDGQTANYVPPKKVETKVVTEVVKRSFL